MAGGGVGISKLSLFITGDSDYLKDCDQQFLGICIGITFRIIIRDRTHGCAFRAAAKTLAAAWIQCGLMNDAAPCQAVRGDCPLCNSLRISSTKNRSD